MQNPEIIVQSRSVRRPNWLLIAYEEIWNYPWTWRHAVLLLIALGALGRLFL
jgi:hypothetical protein